ncbi:MAG: PIN domain-containing protein [Ginsengibacter sp.]
MRIFLDANILVSLLNKEYPYFTFTSRIISLAGKPGYNLYTSPVCLAIAFYFAEKKFRSAKAKEKIRILCEHFQIATTTKECVLQTLRNTAITDLEDAWNITPLLDANAIALSQKIPAIFISQKLKF